MEEIAPCVDRLRLTKEYADAEHAHLDSVDVAQKDRKGRAGSSGQLSHSDWTRLSAETAWRTLRFHVTRHGCGTGTLNAAVTTELR